MSKVLSRREFMRKMALGSLSASMLTASLARVLEAQPVAERQPLIWLKGESSGIHETTMWSAPEFFPFVNRHFQVLSPETANGESGDTRASGIAPTPILILTGYFAEETESALMRQAEDLITSSRAVILYGNESAYSAKRPDGFLDIEEHFLRPIKKPIIKLPGNPTPNRYLLGVLNYLILYDKIPELDEYRRPKMFYATTVCDRCEYRGDFEAGNFVRYFGEKEGCLYHLGCKGPITRNSCPTYRFNDSRNWCVSAGSPCTGCSEPDFDSHSGLGLYGSVSAGNTGINSFLIRHSETIAKGVLGVATAGVGLHFVANKMSSPMEIHSESLNGDAVDE